jgi:hypothetical protein
VDDQVMGDAHFAADDALAYSGHCSPATPEDRGKPMNRSILAIALLLAAIWTTGCESKGSAPKASKQSTASAEPGPAAPAAAASPTTVAVAAANAPAADSPKQEASKAEAPKADAAKTVADKKWTVLFDGKSIDDWKAADYGGNEGLSVEDGEMIIPAGATLSGANYTKPTPKMNYEVELVGRRRSGSDFWCGLTVPVGETHVSLILGGWGGSVCGISSIDGMDASENSTTSGQTFKKNQLYTARLRIAEHRIQAWLDKEQIADVDTTDKRLSIRLEVSRSKPFGIATWQTEGGIKSIKIRELTADEAKEKKPE